MNNDINIFVSLVLAEFVIQMVFLEFPSMRFVYAKLYLMLHCASTAILIALIAHVAAIVTR